jgi:glycosyltransferase involved in cell wall biosynthesis
LVKKRKILFIVPSLLGGGAEKVLTNFLKNFDYNRYEVTLCVVLNEGIYFNSIPEEVKIKTLLNNKYLLKIFNYLHIKLNIILFLKKIIRYKIKDYYDVGISVIDSSYTDLLLFLQDQIQIKCTWVHASIKSYSNYYKYLTKKKIKYLQTNRYQKLDKIIFVSHDSKREFTQVYGEFNKMPVLYHYMDKSDILKSAKQPINQNLNDKIINIVAVGSLLPVKGYENLIHASDQLKKDSLKFKIRILGDGPLYDRLLSLIRSLSLDEEVKLMGFCNNPYPLMNHSDIFTMTSYSEALPTSMIEAMILGIPVLATDSPGCREIMDNGNYGIMVEKSVDSIYKGLKKLIEKKELREKYSILSKVRATDFNDDKILEDFYQILDNK